MIRTATITTIATLTLSACGSDSPVDQLQQVSDECQRAVKAELRDPESASYGEEEYIAKVELPSSTTEENPSISTGYGLVGSVNGRNGFGGMGEFQSYQCDVYFDKDGNLLQDSTHIGYVDDVEFLENYVGYLEESALEPITTRTIEPDESAK